jgi:selenium-binding protein 1
MTALLGEQPMSMRPDPTFHASAKLAMEAPAETFAYTLLLSSDFSRPDALAVIDVDPRSPEYGKIVHTVTMPNTGDEFHHFGWNACSSALSPLSGHAFVERRYLIIPGLRSSRIYIIDTKPHPTQARIHKIIEPEEVFRKTGYSRPHTVHCGPDGIYVSTLGGGGADGTDGPPGIFIMDCETFDVLGRWEIDRGPQRLHYDFWWNLPRDYMVSSGWGLPPQFENGVVPEDLLANKYGHHIHFWDLRARRNVQTIDLGANHQMALEVRPAHDPIREYGFLGVVVDTSNLEGSVWTWWRDGETFRIEKTATIPPESADADLLPPLLKGFGAVPPLITDIDLSLDDKFLYVSCWGTGELRQYDVTEPRRPKLAGSVHVGGIVHKKAHANGSTFAGGPQMVEISRDGKRVYFTNSLYSSWDDQFYPGGVPAAMAMADVNPAGGMTLNGNFRVQFPEGYRNHQTRLEGGDCSTDSFCYPSA